MLALKRAVYGVSRTCARISLVPTLHIDDSHTQCNAKKKSSTLQRCVV